MILLAPVRSTGGIATWAQQVLENWPGRLFVIDTSPWMRKPSQRLNAANSLLAVALGAVVWTRALARATLTKEAVWVTAAPSLGFRVRDVPFLQLARALRIRTVLHIHGSLITGLIGASPRSRAWATAGIHAASEVVVLDSRTVHEISRLTGRTPLKLPNFTSVPGHEAGFEGSRLRVLYVGRVSREKGSETLLAIGSSLPDNASMVIVGPIDPAIESEFVRSCSELRIAVVGEVTPKEVRECMNESSLLILPSHHEGFPMVVLEAMAVSLPVVAADVGACKEMLADGDEAPAGIVLPSPEHDGGAAFVDGVSKILGSPSVLASLRGGRKRVANQYVAAQVIPRMVALAEESIP